MLTWLQEWKHQVVEKEHRTLEVWKDEEDF
jgi:hypothetical protein